MVCMTGKESKAERHAQTGATLLIGGAIREAVLWLSETDDPDDYARVEDTLEEMLRSIFAVPDGFDEEPTLKVKVPPPEPAA